MVTYHIVRVYKEKSKSHIEKLKNHPTNPFAANLITGPALKCVKLVKFNRIHPENWVFHLLMSKCKYKQALLIMGLKRPGEFWIHYNSGDRLHKHQFKKSVNVYVTADDIKKKQALIKKKKEIKALYEPDVKEMIVRKEKTIRGIFENDLFQGIMAIFRRLDAK